MTISCQFRLKRASNIYYCGERIEGSITIRPLKPRQVEGIYVEFCGQTQVAWWDLDKTAVANNIEHNDFSTREVREKTLFSNRQKHVCDQLKLANRQWLQPHVEYEYQFSFLIPQQVPATSRCPLGHCEYALQLVLQHTKKANKELHQKIIVKRKLDLSQNLISIKPCTVTRQNQFGRLELSTPCLGFTPGQRIPYLLNFQTVQLNCKVLIQLNCFIRCRAAIPCDSEKLVKQITNTRKHTGCGKIMAYCTLSLDSKISMPPKHKDDDDDNDDDDDDHDKLILSYQYMLQALAIDANKKIQLAVNIPLTIGTTPCYKSCSIADEETNTSRKLMCFDNFGSSHAVVVLNSMDFDKTTTTTTTANNCNEMQQIYESLRLLPIKKKSTNLRRSLRYCYKKISKII